MNPSKWFLNTLGCLLFLAGMMAVVYIVGDLFENARTALTGIEKHGTG